MPILIMLLGAIGAAAIWYWRIKAAREMGGELLDAANDVRLAARRFGYRRKHNVHPGDSIDDPRIAATGLLIAIAESDGALTAAELEAVRLEIQRVFDIASEEADELIAVGRWVIGQCGGAQPALRRLAKRLRVLAGGDVLPDLMKMGSAVAAVGGNNIEAQEAIAQIRRTIAN
ncbi:TerB family tellurite resistance protein [Pontivivens ytuae]|uniref:TerB family tellurite resistance protein n=1 Tax=Pontivivens ytuae TaxID=2789856 RepID=A0A7S9QCA9_9RHOB|nr:TerB family tellurite resistance protein [Pontivivens ytuae]QPH54003.1 TerB family tellurite resistance protein [Pontivivens ytuae]